MPKSKKVDEQVRRQAPATTIEGREDQLINLAIDLVEKRLMAGTASAQETCHFLKLGSTKDKLEKEIMQRQKDLLVAKTEMIQSGKQVEELYVNALEAMKTYSGNNDCKEGRQNVEDV